MTLAKRKVLYFLLGAGAFLLLFPVAIGLFGGFVAVLMGDFESFGVLAVSTAAVVGLACGVYTVVVLPVSAWQLRVFLSLGIAAGCLSIPVYLTQFGTPAFLSAEGFSFIAGIYIWFCPVAVGVAALVELWMPPNNALQRDAHGVASLHRGRP